MTEQITLDIKDEHIAIITLNRPEAANALSKTMLDELNEVIRKINGDSSLYCTIITAAGKKVFCAGADLKERRGMSEQQVIDTVRYIGETMTAIEEMKMPVIAAINGSAFGGGLELALACDLRIAAEDVKLGLTEASLAIIPGAGGTQRLPRLIGLGHAKRLIFTAKPIHSQEALSIGLVEQSVDGDDLQAEAYYLAKTIAANGPIALMQAKKAINAGMLTDLSTGLELEHLHYKETLPTSDRIEGLQAFKEKRKPVYKGK
ncbi:enoyl-CoA hydratase [Oceanobacillus saliphilus]|uniref:enoyl-CoA hydratase n=1 Tax=Oceanobacillus saliphilus TaxID=2925834 RepID=UPI00201E1E30|nr:enoyl-CoA hydratase [Oceanobacillus saliphilus]